MHTYIHIFFFMYIIHIKALVALKVPRGNFSHCLKLDPDGRNGSRGYRPLQPVEEPEYTETAGGVQKAQTITASLRSLPHSPKRIIVRLRWKKYSACCATQFGEASSWVYIDLHRLTVGLLQKENKRKWLLFHLPSYLSTNHTHGTFLVHS